MVEQVADTCSVTTVAI